MKNIDINQFSPSVHVGDGITNGMFYLQKILLDLGFKSNIFAENIDTELEGKVLHYTKINSKDRKQILFVHYSIYYDFSKWIDKVESKKIMIYHNITPHRFFEKGSYLYTLCKKGKEYLPSLATKVSGAIGDSDLNTKELQDSGFTNIKTIPLLLDIGSIAKEPWNKTLFDEKVEKFNIIFVGRIAKNKAQHDLIEVAHVYKNIYDNFKMYIIGGVTDVSYKADLTELISRYKLNDNVIIAGKISNEDLYAYYRSANLFLCMSEHEGFGVPLIESMVFGVPVIAYNSSNIKNTLNGGGILFNEKSPEHIAATIEIIRKNRAFKREIQKIQYEALKSYSHEVIVSSLVSYLKTYQIECVKKEKKEKKEILYQFEGPFDSSYSLAMVNRYSALAFNEVYPEQVSLFPTEGHGDYAPDKKFIISHPQIEKMYEKSEKAMQCKVVLRNLYPPRVTGMSGKINILNSYGWEESGFPRKYVDKFNKNLDGITVMSSYVKSVLKNSGVKVPIEVVGLGADHIIKSKAMPLNLKTDKKFKFLHISSCFPRKGADILLKAYCEVFTATDDVCLVIKTFPNPHNDIEKQIAKIKKENQNHPEIVLINKNLEDAYISWLYQNCDCLVAPSRGEGFGLPMAEAMLCNLPVITTGFGGQTDFCKYENSWLIDYSFKKADTHLNVFNSYWVEPDYENLKYLLKEQIALSEDKKQIKTDKANSLIATHFTWEKYREKTDNFIKSLEKEEIFDTDPLNIAWISSYNTKCGIAAYSEFIFEEMDCTKYNIVKFANHSDEVLCKEKEKNTIRCWNNRFDSDNSNLINEIVSRDFDTVIINFNFGFFSMQNLEIMLNEFLQKKLKIIIIFHSVTDVTIKGLEASLSLIKETLSLVDNILVHNIDDLNYMKNLNNIDLFPHGIKNRKKDPEMKKNNKFIISSYGFLLPHKGILELIESFSIVEKTFPQTELLLVTSLYPAEDSKKYYEACKKRVNELGLSQKVKFETEFLDDVKSFEFLDASDLLVMPYRKTNESSSAAVRYALSTCKPVLCTKQSIFNDVEEIVHFTEGYSPKDMAGSISKLIQNKLLLDSKSKIQKEWIEEHDWKNVSQKLENIIRAAK